MLLPRPDDPVSDPAVPVVVAGRHFGGAWKVALFLAILIGGLVGWHNRQYLFHTELYEFSDFASNSLFVREAKSGWLLHGHYSRWAFYHPGPAFLNTLAVGEALFYDVLHLVPTPFNGQILALCAVLSLFFAFALAIFVRRVGRGGWLFFLPLALLFALWHYGTLNRERAILALMDPWPPCPLIIVFLCFVVAVASTAAGSGWELPVLVAAGGWLVHIHVAQPLFVVPLTLFAYAGLLIACWRLPVEKTSRNPLRFLVAGWRHFPRAHVLAVVILLLYILPLAIDALHGADSNFARITAHLHEHRQDPGKKFLRSLCYFLVFGGYGDYRPGNGEFGHYDAAGMLAFVGHHWRAYGLWAAAVLGGPLILFGATRRRRLAGLPDEGNGAGHFLAWFYVATAAAFGLTLIWGMKQDGPMCYFNAYFNYSIYYLAALGLAAALAVALAVWTAPPPRRNLRWVISAFLWIAVGATGFSRAEDFGAGGFGTPENRLMASHIAQAATTLNKDEICFLDCDPWSSWPMTVAVALELERLGYQVRVKDSWEILFGVRHTTQRERFDRALFPARWTVAPPDPDQEHFHALPLVPGLAINVADLRDVGPAGQTIDFSRHGNAHDFAFFGWTPSDGDWTWSEQSTGMLRFRPLAFPAGSTGGMDLWFKATSFNPPGQSNTQRMELVWNGKPLEQVRLPVDAPGVQPVCVHLSAALWREAVEQGSVTLLVRFPDAGSLVKLGLGNDPRLFGGAFRSIEFRPTP